MLQILFNESAEGSLKSGCHYGKGEYKPGITNFINTVVETEDSYPDEELLADLKREHDTHERIAWESAQPMDFESGDIFALPLAMNEGDISSCDCTENRMNVIRELYNIQPEDEVFENFTGEMEMRVDMVKSRLAAGEDACIWYSNQSDDLCCLFWFLTLADKIGASGSIYLLECPKQIERDGKPVNINNWAELEPGDWYKYWPRRRKAEPALLKVLTERWRELQKENAPLRAYINGGLHSVAESFYDSLIEVYVSAMEDEFSEAYLITEILNNSRLGISDVFIAKRIDKMIEEGMLEIDTRFPEEKGFYRRTLRKKNI